jgi:hypothetical protein
MTNRIYIIKPKTGDVKPRLVRAGHPSTALQHVAKDTLTVSVASQNDLEAAFLAGIKVEKVGAEQANLPNT